ncbi:hypothetical protein R1sor_024943 [Riccia sorocarpa]|uniref:NADP-dependent oxidoreductase domain-containing protein n=1 Tax=Riccia sorocarpa TaxID=122646 RepID=A0ABD3GAE7_9MARC
MAQTALKLSSGHSMPVIGFGLWRAGPSTKDLVFEAIKLGYRHFDCAADYKNEKEVGDGIADALKQGLVKREDLFVVTKLWNSDHKHVRGACEDSLKKLRLEYLDLYLIHFPVAVRHTGVGSTDSPQGEDGVLDIDCTVSLETVWHSMEELVQAGLVRSIGISNYDIFLTRDVLAYSKIKPAVNQIETHPYFQRADLVKFCQKHGIVVTAHTPLGGGASNVELFNSVSAIEDPALKEIGAKYGKSAAQVALRWGIQRGTVVIPKSSKVERLKENLDVLDFNLSDADMQAIKQLEKKARTNNPKNFWGINLYA